MLCGDTMQRSLSLCPSFLKNPLDITLSGPYDALYSCVSLLGRIDMARGRKTSLTIRLTADERQALMA